MILRDGVEVSASIYDIILLLKEHISTQGIKLLGSIKDSPDNVMVSCPYHKGGQERRPSAGIKKTDGTFHCFACEEVHTLPEFISHCFGENDGGAYGYKWLLQNFVLISQEDRRDVELDLDWHKGDVRRSGSVTAVGRSSDCSDSVSKDADNGCFVTEEELSQYRYIHPYMYKRHLTDEVIELFDLGYDKDFVLDIKDRYGNVIDHKHVGGCITFPIRDINGHTIFIARRSVNTKFFHYPEGVEKPLYGLYELVLQAYLRAIPKPINTGTETWYSIACDVFPDEVIVCESMLDALSFWAVGKYAVALNGLGNELQYQQLRDLPCRTIILATDMDDAGKKARKKLRKELPNKIIFEYNFPNGKKDANECTAEELRSLEKIM